MRRNAAGRRRFTAEGPGVAVAPLLAILAGGTVGYVLIEGWSLWDAFVMKGSPFSDRSIVDVNVRQRFGAIVVAIQHQDRQMTFNPEPDVVIRTVDKLVVLGRPDSLKWLEHEAAP